MKILIAEDDTLSRVLLDKTLRQAGYEVIAVENGERAVRELKKEDAPRLALLDWVMPGKDGVCVCREIREDGEQQPYTYLILLSSKESKAEIVEGLESGADDYLTKPFDVEELKARLRAGARILELQDRLVEARESMRFRATHDLLTSLWNRGVIMELVGREVQRSCRESSCTAVMMCDIDHFKQVNDQHGHSVGDDVLREVARRLQQSVRSYDMVGRYGGEEFLVALNRCDPTRAAARADHLRAVVGDRPILSRGKTLSVTVSVGLALSSDDRNCTADEIIQQADKALYAAKQAGRNCVRIAKLEGTETCERETAEATPANRNAVVEETF